MADFPKFTLKYLQELARRHLKRGYSKLKKQQLLEALKKWLPKPTRATARARAVSKPTRKSPSKGRRRSKAPIVKLPSRAAPAVKAEVPPLEAPAKPAPFVESRFFDSPPQEEPRKSPDEDLAHLKRADAGGNFLAALVRDPTSAYVFCAIEPPTLEAAGRGLEDPRPVLRVSAGDGAAWEHYLRPQGGVVYLHGLSPGQAYAVEAVVLGRNGDVRSLGLSDSLQLPAPAASPSRSIRLLRLPWSTPLRESEMRLAALSEWSGRDGVERRVPRASGGAQSSLLAAPSGTWAAVWSRT